MGAYQKLRGRRAALANLLAMPLLLAGCGSAQRANAPAAHTTTPELQPLPTLIAPIPATEAPPTPQPPDPPQRTPDDTGWLQGAGVELRHLRVPAGRDQAQVPLTITRFDPANLPLRVGYRPGKPITLAGWIASEHPILAINGGYFSADYHSTALIVSAGVASGESYQGFGGMLAVHPDGRVELRPLRDQPYDPNEQLNHATQSSPMLVFPGGIVADLEDDGARARRSAVAIDQAGRLLFIVAPTSSLTLRELAAWLAASDLQVDRALNLDGGSSTGMALASGALHETIDAFSPLPIVILAGGQ